MEKVKVFLILSNMLFALTISAVQNSSRAAHSPNRGFPESQALQEILLELTSAGIPGVSMAVISPEGCWTGSAGFSKIENSSTMHPSNLLYLQSVSKTYMAVSIFQLNEKGMIDLDAPISQYIGQKYLQYFNQAEKVSVRMLLNHTSGLPEYNYEPAYISKLLQQPEFAFEPEHYLQKLKGKDFDFTPGTHYSYRNTNYLLLALIADYITGDHAQFMHDHIFAPLGLSNTFYRNHKGYLDRSELADVYWDRYSTGIVENATVIQKNNVSNMIGDDGIVATPQDAVLFLKGLLEGQLISAASLDMMQTWIKGQNGLNEYGQGLDYARINGVHAIGHSGGGIGAGCQLYYFPAKDLYVFVGINLGTVTGSPLHKTAEPVIKKLYDLLLE